MVTARLNHTLALAAASVVGTTLLGGLLAVVDPALAGPTPPHPVLQGTPLEGLSILADNTVVLAIPYLLAASCAACRPCGWRLGDLAVAAIACENTLAVGVALGHWRARLLPYIPQLPLEWAALTTAVFAWLTVRTGWMTPRELARLAATTLLLLTAAAALETWATPHRGVPMPASIVRRVNAVCDRTSTVDLGGLGRHRWCTGDGHIAARSRLPSPHGVRFRSAAGPVLTGRHQPPDPTRRDHMNSLCVVWNSLRIAHIARCDPFVEISEAVDAGSDYGVYRGGWDGLGA